MKVFILMVVLLSGRVLMSYDGLTIKIWLEKEDYYEEEIISSRLTFTNNSKENISLSYNCAFEDDVLMYLNFVDETGYPYKLQTSFVYCCIGGSIVLKPGKEYETYGVSLLTNSVHKFEETEYLPAGNYLLYYKSFIGISDTVKFNIIKSNNYDDKNELQKMLGIVEKEERFKECRKYLKSNKASLYNNRYFEELTYLRNMYQRYDNPEKVYTADLVRFFGKAPNAYYNDAYMIYSAGYLRQTYSNKTMLDFLRSVTKKYPGTSVEHMASKILHENKLPELAY